MAYWIKINYERREYVVNLECVKVFCYEQNGRLTFWLPDSAIAIVINPQTNSPDYQKISQYVQQITVSKLENNHWVKIHYDRNEYLINLDCISSFCYEPSNKRITFWLPDGTIPIIINPVSNPKSYEQVVTYIKNTTGYSLSE